MARKPKRGRPRGRNFPNSLRASLSDAQLRKLDALATEHDISHAAMIRRLIDNAPRANR